MRSVPEVTELDAVFGGKAMELLPPMKEIPEEFKNDSNRWVKVVRDWFYRGLEKCKWVPKDGVDTASAIRVIRACIGSYEPDHHHKTAGCAYLLSEWFEDVSYETVKK